MARHDIVIIGSGFGGAVMAARIGTWVADTYGGDKTVHVLDKGQDPTGHFDPASLGRPLNDQGNRFRHTLDPRYLNDVGEVHTDLDAASAARPPSMRVLAGTGIGGGSNLYLGVSLRAPQEAFNQVQADGRRRWPARHSRTNLDEHYARVERELRVSRLAWTDERVPHWQLATKRDFVFAEGCRRIGATALPLKLASHQDANEGWWSQGQRFEGRQSLTKNYLKTAKASGVTFQSGSEVTEIAPTGDGYVVFGIDRRSGRDIPFEVECRVLVVAAGAVQSTALLLRSEESFGEDRALDPGRIDGPEANLGRHLSSNGDYGVTGTVGRDFAHAVEGFKGKPMSSFCPSFWREHQFIVIPFYAEPAYLALEQFTTLSPARDPRALGRWSTTVNDGNGEEPRWGGEYMKRLYSFGDRMLTMGCLTLDACEGEISIRSSDGRAQVQWAATDPRTEVRWSAAVDAMRRIYEALGGEMYLDGYRKDGTVNTSHPLGGSRMADDELEGIVNATGESFRNPNLFVVDGAIIPSALGVNPSLTIAAVAESIAGRLIAGEGTVPLVTRLA